MVADPAVIGAIRLDVASPDPVYRELVRAGFFADADPAVADAALALLSPDAPVAIAAQTTTLSSDGWAAVPRTYIICSQDRIVRPALQQRFINEANTAYPEHPVHVMTLDSSHCPFLSIPDELATALCAN